MKPNHVYHQFTVLYFPETDTWQISDEFSDGVYDCETYVEVGGDEYEERHEATDEKALAKLNELLANASLKETE